MQNSDVNPMPHTLHGVAILPPGTPLGAAAVRMAIIQQLPVDFLIEHQGFMLSYQTDFFPPPALASGIPTIARGALLPLFWEEIDWRWCSAVLTPDHEFIYLPKDNEERNAKLAEHVLAHLDGVFYAFAFFRRSDRPTETQQSRLVTPIRPDPAITLRPAAP